MPQQTLPSGQDWESQNAGRGGIGGKRMTVPTTGRELAHAKALGLVTTEKRQVAGANTHTSTIMSARKLDEATEAATIVRVDKELSKAIAQARSAMKLSQKDLATAINSKPQLIAEYENGKAIPDARIIGMLERKLQTKLPRPGKSKPPPKDAASAGAKSAAKGTSGGAPTGPAKRR